MFKAKTKAIVVIKAKATQDNTGELTPVAIVGGANTGSPGNGGAMVAVDGHTFAADLDLLSQSDENGTKSFAKAQVINSIGEEVKNSSFLSALRGDGQNGGNNANFPSGFETVSFQTSAPSETPVTNPSQSSIAFSDEDSKSQYVVLQREGLNVLRSEIIAAMEYIPMASAENDTSLNEQDNNSEYQEIKIRNITKIIELHRQIREYMISAAAKVYDRTFSSYGKMINANFPSIGVVDRYSIVGLIEASVKNWFSQGLLGGGANTANILISLAENAQEADNTTDAVVTTIIETIIDTNNTLSTLFSGVDLNNGQANILFYRGLIEFFVYKTYIDIMIVTYLSIEEIKELPAIEWQIDVSGVREANVADLMQPGINQIGPMYFKSMLKDNDIPDFYKNELGVIKTAGASDTSLLYQTLMFMYSQLGLRDSVKAFDRNISLPIDEKEFNGDSLRIGHSNDLRDSFQQLTQLKIHDFIAHLGTGTAYVRLGDFVSGQNLSKSRFRNIGSQMSQLSSLSKYRQTSEMLAAYAFDFCINLNSPRRIGLFGTGNNNSNFLFSSFGGLTYDQYRKQVLLGNFSSTGAQQLGLNENSTNKNIPTPTFFDKQQSGPLILGSQTGGQSFRELYLDMGVDIYESGINTGNGNSLKPGSEYVFDNLILPQTLESYTNSEGQIVDQSVKDTIESAFGGYKENSINFLKDLGSIFISFNEADNFNGTLSKHVPIGKMSAKHRIKNLLTYLAEDFDRIIDSPARSVPLLAILLSVGSLNTSGDTFKKMQLYAFLANFWGFIDSSLFSELLGLEPASNSEEKRLILSDLISGLAHFYNEKLIQFFLEGVCDFNIDNCLRDQGYHGGKYAYAKKVSSAAAASAGIGGEGFDPAGFDKAFQVFLTDDNASYPVYPVSKVKSLGNLSSGTEDLPNEVGLGNKYNMRENLNRSFTRSATFLHDAFYDRDLSDSTSRKNLGLFRLFSKSLSAAAADLDFSNYLGDDIDYTALGLTVDPEDVQGMLKIFTFANPADNQLPRFSDSESNYKSSLGPLKLKMHHKALVWYKWVFSLINSTGLQMSANITNSNDGTFKIKYNKSQLRGIRDGLLAAADKIGDVSQIVDLRNQIETDSAYKRIKRTTIGKVGELAYLIEQRERIAATTSTLLTNHATSIVKTYENSNIPVSSLGPGILTGLALTPLMGEVQLNALATTVGESSSSDIVAKWASAGLTIINKKSIASITDSAIKYFNFDNNKDLLVTSGLTSSASKIEFMYKVLSSPGYGFLESEKKGLKTIINVGLPAGLVNILQKNAVQETGNTKFSDSQFVCITIHKKNHLDVTSFYDPKHFVFDTGANILDLDPSTKQVSSHLQNFSKENSLTSILSEIDITRISSSGNSGLSISQNYTTNKAKNTSFVTDKGMKVLMNHAISYSLKEYLKLTTGIDMSEDSFVINLGQPNTSSSTSINVDQTKEEIFQFVLKTLNNSYPQVNDDPQLRNEVFRLTNIIKQMPPFSNKQNYIKTISPRKFDKVYSIFINEKDFTLRDNPDIFTQIVNKNIGTEIEIDSDVSQTKLSDYIASRSSNTNTEDSTLTNSLSTSQADFEEIVQEGLGDIFINRDININKQINGYIRSLNENAPEVYNYSVSIALLPSDFLTSKL